MPTNTPMYLKTGDRHPDITRNLLYADGSPILLNSVSTVVFRFKKGNAGTPIEISCTIENVSTGEVSFDWSAALLTAPAGCYKGEFLLTFTDGEEMRVPNGHGVYIDVFITESI